MRHAPNNAGRCEWVLADFSSHRKGAVQKWESWVFLNNMLEPRTKMNHYTPKHRVSLVKQKGLDGMGGKGIGDENRALSKKTKNISV